MRICTLAQEFECLKALIFIDWFDFRDLKRNINPLVPDAHYSECPDKLVSLQIKLLEANLQLIRDFFYTLGTSGLTLFSWQCCWPLLEDISFLW